MAESLHVIALISGGKDSFYSLLHCLQNGHKVVALGNLHPPVPQGKSASAEETEDEHDLNSFMYQTVGHTVIPLYEQALGIPLYRQPIVGSAVHTGTTYGHSDVPAEGIFRSEQDGGQEEDETESLVPLLRRIIAEHPTANALSTGAILSTYQRTRIESVALRLGLIPLAYLWQYPTLPPGSQSSLLQDMNGVGLDARIVKVASGGLDESFLWQNVASDQVIKRIERSMKRYGTDGDGAILGEGGEFETLVIDGPSHLFKGRIEIQEQDRSIVQEGGGSAWLKITKAAVVMKPHESPAVEKLRIPDLLDARFSKILQALKTDSQATVARAVSSPNGPLPSFNRPKSESEQLMHWSTSAPDSTKLQVEVLKFLTRQSLPYSRIVSTVIILRSMQDFATVNKVYGSLFMRPNPPARVTISSGDTLPDTSKNIMIHLNILPHSRGENIQKRALHVQSRSYWAPANIGPYSQAISLPVATSSDESPEQRTVTVAGQIALVPHKMKHPSVLEVPWSPLEDFQLETVLSLQHLWRIGIEMKVGWWTSAVAYLPRDRQRHVEQQAAIASRAWTMLHTKEPESIDEEDDERDIWEEKHYAGMEARSAIKAAHELPDWSLVVGLEDQSSRIPPFFAIEVVELPRGSRIEWHAHLGVVGGPIELLLRRSTSKGWAAYQCNFGDQVHTIVAIDAPDPEADPEATSLAHSLADAFETLGIGNLSESHSYLAYCDPNEVIDCYEDYGSYVPCHSIWDAYGTKLAAVFLYDNL